jgi:hypothetical protein
MEAAAAKDRVAAKDRRDGGEYAKGSKKCDPAAGHL